jgi:hypothetical protein
VVASRGSDAGEGREGLTALVAAIERGDDGIVVPDLLTGADVENPELEPYRTFFVKVRSMSVPERMKLAMRGNKEVRIILLKDSIRLVTELVLRNPKITEDEIVAITHNRSADEELIRIIAEKREWTRNYQVRLGLVTNPKTPAAAALRHLVTLEDRDVRRLAKSKNVPDAVRAQARRIVAQRQVRGQR